MVMSFASALAMVASGAMAGVPLLNGFLSKEMFFSETIDLQSHHLIEFIVPVVATVAAKIAAFEPWKPRSRKPGIASMMRPAAS